MENQISIVAKWLGSGSINIFGMPYAGKDTQGTELAKLFGAPLLGGGDILRNSVIPEHVKALIDVGELAPTEDFVRIVLPYLSQPDFAGKPLILSSVGRWHGEEEGVIQAAEASGHPLKAVVLLTISEDILRQRWQTAQKTMDRGARADDAQDILSTRLAEFRQKTLPVIETYRAKNILIELDGNGSMNEVTTRILDALAQRATAL